MVYMEHDPLIALLLAGVIVTGEALAPGIRKHIEPRHYQEFPALIGNAGNIAASSTATVIQYQIPLIPDQYI